MSATLLEQASGSEEDEQFDPVPEGVQGDDDDDNHDEEDEDDEEEEEEVSGRPRKRTRRDPRNQYLDVEAEVDEEDEGDEEDEEGQADPFIADTHPDDLADLPVGAQTDDRRHRELDRQRERDLQMDAEKQAKILNERYSSKRTQAKDTAIVPQRLLLPSVNDPSIWGVKCKPTKEREVVFTIMKRIDSRARSKNPLPIISAFERSRTMAGMVYVEARRFADVKNALEGILDVFPNGKKSVLSHKKDLPLLVPIKEMPDLLQVTKNKQLQPGGYVRIKRGKYAGDLAQIDDVETNGLEVSLRIVPRLYYGLNDDSRALMAEVQKRKRPLGKGAKSVAHFITRPPQRLFSEVEAKKNPKTLQSMSTFDKKHWSYQGDTYINGYLIKDFKIQALYTENVNPALEEVTKFTAGAEDGTENLDLAALAASVKTTITGEAYLPGDMVEVYEGEQKGVYGKAVSVRGDIVTLSVTDGELRGQSIEVPVKGLRKKFKEGDHVKVIGGSRYRDEVGMVVCIKDDTVTILSDLSMHEITVFSKDLREASDSGIAGGIGWYDIHDLVQLDPATVGCVIKVDRESLLILDQNNSIRTIKHSQISNRIDRLYAIAVDRNGSEIRVGDTVRESGGEKRQGVIRHIYHSFLFLFDRSQTQSSGLSVVRTNNVTTVAARGGRVAQGANSGPDLTRMNPALQRNGTNGNAAMAPPKSTRYLDRSLYMQSVTIKKGPNKGLLGIVKGFTDTHAAVELHSKNTTIKIPKEDLHVQHPHLFTEYYTPAMKAKYANGPVPAKSDGGRSGFAGATPSREPDWSGGRTPSGVAQGGRTPAWGASSRTPAWSGSSSRTPMWRPDGMSGGRTPAYGGGEGGRTVNPYADGSRTAYGDLFGGSRTPAYAPESSRTPAYTSTSYDAPTPGMDIQAAPTPAAAAPTPRFSGYAADAPTPYSGQPETPAGGGDDSAPRYEDGTPSP